ncbi:ATP-binding protein [Streptomyces mirabilis]|uniref:ATP-binding protein n=1 Tax=Streptomyces mirabilis TaxID=68239 RepID=UPI0033AB1CF9
MAEAAASLVNEPVDAADDKQLGKSLARCGRVDLLEIDELGCLELDRRGAEMLFQFLPSVGERSASRSHPTRLHGWSRTFTDPRLCVRWWTGPPSAPP